MGPLGRFSGAALHCFFSLAALSCKTYVASGASTKAADGVGDFARVAEEHIRTDPHAVTRASITVKDGGSLPARQQEMNLHNINTDVASEGVGERHHGTSDDVRGKGQRVVIGADGSLYAGVGDDRVVRQKTLHSEELTEGQVVEDGSAGVSEHARSESEAAAHLRTRDGGDVVVVLFFLLLVAGLIAGAVFLYLYVEMKPAEHGGNGFPQLTWSQAGRQKWLKESSPAESSPAEVDGDDNQPQSSSGGR